MENSSANSTENMMIGLQASGVNVIIFLALQCIVALVTCFGNLTVIIAFARTPQLRRRNKAMVALVVNLAVSDLFNGAVAIPFFVVPHYAATSTSKNPVVCVLSYMFLQYSVSVSSCTMAAIAVERYMAIVHPFRGHSRCFYGGGSWRLGLVLAVVWGYPALVLAVLVVPWVKSRQWALCEMSMVLPPYHSAVLLGHLGFVFVLATSLYCKILHTVRRSKREVGKYSSSSSSGRGGDGGLRTTDVKLTRTLAILMIVFYVCFVPELLKALVHLLLGMPSPEPLWLNIVDQCVLVFVMLSPCVDPFIYGWKDRKLRKTILNMFCLERKADACGEQPHKAIWKKHKVFSTVFRDVNGRH